MPHSHFNTIKDALNNLLLLLIPYGIKLDEFWDYTIKELNLIYSAYSEQEKRDNQTRAYIAYQQAALTASFVAGKAVKIYDAFPGFFTEEEKQDAETEKLKNSWLNYAETHNAARRKTG